MIADSLFSTTAPWILLVACNPSEFTNLLWRLKREQVRGGVVVQIRGSNMRTRWALFDEMSAALQFPYYFGNNWDALDECLNDLEWLPANCYVVAVFDAARVLETEVEELRVFGAMLARTCEEWATPVAKGEPWDRPAVPFHALLQCEEGQVQDVVDRYERAGVRVVHISMDAL